MTVLAIADLLFGSRIRQAAEAAGVDVAFAPRDSDVSARAHELRPAAVLLDLTTAPLVAETILALRADPALAGLRIVGYAGHAQAELIQAAQAAGADAVYSKGELTRRLPELMQALARG